MVRPVGEGISSRAVVIGLLVVCSLHLLHSVWVQHTAMLGPRSAPRCVVAHRRQMMTRMSSSSSMAAQNLSAVFPTLTQFARPFEVWGARPRAFPTVTLALYRETSGKWEDFARAIQEEGFEEAERRVLEALLAGECSKGALMVDVGAFVGYYTMIAASKGCRVHVWEAHPQNVGMLELGVALNGLHDRVTVHPNICAAGKEPMVFSGTAMDGHVSKSYAKTDNPLRQAELSTELRSGDEPGTLVWPLSLDSVINEDVRLLKVDVEGYEPHVFAGARSLLQRRKVKFVLFEFNMWRAMTLKEGVTLLMQLLEWRYELYGLPCTDTGPLRRLTQLRQVENLAGRLQNNTYHCGQWAINMLAARDGLPSSMNGKWDVTEEP